MSSMYGPARAGGSGPVRPRRRSRLSWILLISMLLLPIVEIYVLVQVGQVIGAGWTIILVIAMAVLGVWAMRREGARTWQKLRTEVNAGRTPTQELADGALILIGGTLMIVPGFVTDVVGILLVLPFTRAPFRKLLAALLAKRAVSVRPPGGFPGGFPGGPRRPGPGDGPVVRGDVVDP